MNHVLIIGGTGMLREVSEYFIKKRFKVTLMARTGEPLIKLKEMSSTPSNVEILKQDYTNVDKALYKIEKAIKKQGTVDLAVLWIHDIDDKFREKLRNLLLSQSSRVRIFELSGSGNLNQKKSDLDFWRKEYPDNCREIILGRMKLRNGLRWLTNEEIATGTLNAIHDDKAHYVIGTLE